jgi:hypothetical protein
MEESDNLNNGVNIVLLYKAIKQVYVYPRLTIDIFVPLQCNICVAETPATSLDASGGHPHWPMAGSLSGTPNDVPIGEAPEIILTVRTISAARILCYSILVSRAYFVFCLIALLSLYNCG